MRKNRIGRIASFGLVALAGATQAGCLRARPYETQVNPGVGSSPMRFATMKNDNPNRITEVDVITYSEEALFYVHGITDGTFRNLTIKAEFYDLEGKPPFRLLKDRDGKYCDDKGFVSGVVAELKVPESGMQINKLAYRMPFAQLDLDVPVPGQHKIGILASMRDENDKMVGDPLMVGLQYYRKGVKK